MSPSLDQTLTALLAGGLSTVVYACLHLLDQNTAYHTLAPYHRAILDVAVATVIALAGAYAATYALAALGNPLPPDAASWARHLWQTLYLTLAASELIKQRDQLPTDRARLARDRADQRARQRALMAASRTRARQ
jgi:hypothetical protein